MPAQTPCPRLNPPGMTPELCLVAQSPASRINQPWSSTSQLPAAQTSKTKNKKKRKDGNENATPEVKTDKLPLGICPSHHGPQDTRDPSIYGLDIFFQAFWGSKDCSQNKPDRPPNQKAEYHADCLTHPRSASGHAGRYLLPI